MPGSPIDSMSAANDPNIPTHSTPSSVTPMFITGDSPPAFTRYQSRHTAVVRNSTVGIADGPLL